MPDPIVAGAGRAGRNEIVVGADGSAHGLIAVAWAAGEALRRDADLRIVYAVAPWLFDVPVDPRVGAIREWMHDNGDEVLQQALAHARERAPGVRVSGEQVPGQPAEALIRESGRALMIVVGTHGMGGVAGLLLGSVGLQVVAHASCPAVAVREEPPMVGEPGIGEPVVGEPVVGEIVVGVDGSENSVEATAFAFEEASLRGARLRAVLAWSHGPGDMRPLGFDPDAVHAEAERALAASLAEWRVRFPEVDVVRDVVRARPVRALSSASDGAELLVVGTRGRGGFAGLVLGSVSHALLHHARCPLAVVPHPRA
ncbi:universal stress protein [Actinomadura sp. 9N407]|uniref:universal stress protein n=1 Tax=Actinomadura sp. 9N407 TaxID=3375154 RepID=UPI0037A431CD